MNKKIILLAEDDDSIQLVTSEFLSSEGYAVRSAKTLNSLWRLIEKGDGDVLVTDVMFPDGESFDLIPQIKELRPNLPIIIISARNNLQTAISSVEKGAFEYLPKPFDLNDLNALINKALVIKPKLKGQTLIRKKSSDLIIGSSKAMQEMYRVIGRLSQNDLTVMIYGESGTGKELVSKALHIFGKRSDHPFVAVNMAAIPNELIESELFGHEKGSFTGAYQKSDGKFKQAEKGTLFLDEIGDMPIEAQTRLLRVLQEGEFTSVGGKEKIKTDVRIVAATNKDLKSLIKLGSFREDLFYRLNVVPIHTPALRDKIEDIPELVEHFLGTADKLGLPIKKIDKNAITLLMNHYWPGNVRELENFLLRVCALYSEDTLSEEIVEKELLQVKVENQSVDNIGLSKIIDGYFANNLNKLLKNNNKNIYSEVISEVEQSMIKNVLFITKGNQLKAAQILGLNRNTLRKKIGDLNINIQLNDDH
ncbi:nitrogen regulation protein NR(I) [Hyphomicrobiales bacterium]|jgi:two-component system nitrogen regulation response regulator GlnG|nr:nitrogen regulation protein NR(I) [Hyphomicrobiales bacterium]|tara:strand:+ start:933 stop:2363 length:1431 start_codon:yes stop_codon:yes gene_type:complete